MSAVAGVLCPVCGKVDLTEEEYTEQMQRPNSLWYCPRCRGHAEFDQERFEELLPPPEATAPTRWLILMDGQKPLGSDDPEEAKTAAETLAADNPGKLAHVYQHVISMRAKE